MSAADAFVARTSPVRTGLLVLASLAFVAAGAWMIGWFGEAPASRRWSQDGLFWLGWAAILFFGPTGLRLSRRVVKCLNPGGDGKLRWSWRRSAAHSGYCPHRL